MPAFAGMTLQRSKLLAAGIKPGRPHARDLRSMPRAALSESGSIFLLTGPFWRLIHCRCVSIQTTTIVIRNKNGNAATTAGINSASHINSNSPWSTLFSGPGAAALIEPLVGALSAVVTTSIAIPFARQRGCGANSMQL